MLYDKVDTSDIPEITDYSNTRVNPYADKIKKHGYSITIHYSPEDVERMTQSAVADIKNLDMLELDSDELVALEKYRKANMLGCE
jgi:phosphoribosyl 1,2-cyclic phosphodiesterase